MFYLTRGVLKILAISLFTATALGPVVEAVQRRRVPRAWAILFVYLACSVTVSASNLVAVLSIAFLLILHGDRYAGAVVSLLPPPRAERWRRVAPEIYEAVSAYVIGNLEISVIAGSCAWVAVTVLGVPFAVPLAIVIGFFDLIPLIGATLGAIIVALAALLVSPLTALLWLV